MAINNIKLDDIYDKSLNFIFGSGASAGLFPTLSLKIKNGDYNHTVETLATDIENSSSAQKARLKALLFMHYFKTCIKPIADFELESLEAGSSGFQVIDNYKSFIDTVLSVLNKKPLSERKANLFTTNYDGCLAFTADQILSNGYQEFVINDGSSGFRNRYLHAKNFNRQIRQSGVFAKQHSYLPQINLIHLHGSVYWQKDDESIIVDYKKPAWSETLKFDTGIVEAFSAILDDKTRSFEDLEEYASVLDVTFDVASSEFLRIYDQLPIVNPTKWKFHETVFEEHYYQMLRALSYELEKPNSTLICFGFSFADEHILNLLKRSLSNPQLQLYICCFKSDSVRAMEKKFSGHNNVEFVVLHGEELNFQAFNQKVFSLNPIVESSVEDSP
jgi:hypothetical protein